MEETAISASAFISSLQTNLSYLPEEATKEFQKYRFFSTRKKIAKIVFSATRNEADLDYYFQAYEQLTRCTLAHEVERHRFDESTRMPNSRLRFWLRSFPSRIESTLTTLSGWLTGWGRSLFRSTVFMLVEVDP